MKLRFHKQVLIICRFGDSVLQGTTGKNDKNKVKNTVFFVAR